MQAVLMQWLLWSLIKLLWPFNRVIWNSQLVYRQVTKPELACRSDFENTAENNGSDRIKLKTSGLDQIDLIGTYRECFEMKLAFS